MRDQLTVMESEQDIVKVRDEVFRKIGRNLLKFQNIEQLLKGIILCSNFSGDISNGNISEIEKNYRKKLDEVDNQTMGLLVKQFLESTYLNKNNTSKLGPEVSGHHISMSLGFNADDAFIEDKTQSLKSLVDERNNLVHHLLPKINLHSIASCLEMDKYLDAQRERQIKEHEHLIALIQNITDTLGEFSVFFASDEGQKAVELSMLQQRPVVTALWDFSTRIARSDGWTWLDSAGRELHTTMPDEMANLKKKYGYKTLKEIILACDLFELGTESTQKGGARLLYRIKPELASVYH